MNPTSYKRAPFWSACLGNLFEHYDNALFGFLSPFFAPLLFPNKEPIVALILTYAMIPLGMLARPLGALFFGLIGDRYGRKFALSWTLFGMGATSLLIAFTPLSNLVAPLLFCSGRILQNFFASGESMGGAIYLLENSEEKKRDLLSSLYNASTIGGILLASFGVTLFAASGSIEERWRLLYILGASTALFGAWIRRHSSIEEKSTQSAFFNPLQSIWQERGSFLIILLISGFAYANYSMALVLMNGLIPLVTQFSKEAMAELNSYLLIFDFCLLPLCGYLSSLISRKKIMLLSALSILLGAIPLLSMLHNAPFFTVVSIRLFFVAAGVAFFAPFHAYAQSLVPKERRYLIISLGYAVGSQLIGGPTATISLALFKSYHSLGIAALYWTLLAAISASIILFYKPVTQKELA